MRRRRWWVRIETTELLILTPWAFIWAAHGAMVEAEHALWWGIQIHWDYNPAAEAWCRPWRKEWRWNFRWLPHEVVCEGFESVEAYKRWAVRHWQYPPRWVLEDNPKT